MLITDIYIRKSLFFHLTYFSIKKSGASRCWYSCCISIRRTRGRRDRPAPSGPGPPAASTILCTPIPATSTASGRPRSSSCWRCCASTATCSGILVSRTLTFITYTFFRCLYFNGLTQCCGAGAALFWPIPSLLL